MTRLSKYYFAFIYLLFFSCSEESVNPDNKLPEKPDIELISITPKDAPGKICGQITPKVVMLSSNQELVLKFRIKAKEGLSQYKIDIHSNFDCHTHRTVKTTAQPWKVLEINDLEGTDQILTKTLVVPENVKAGNYHFMMQAIDLAGNEAIPLIFSLTVRSKTDKTPPEVQINTPTTDSVVLNTPKVVLEAVISDNAPLYGGRVEVTYISPAGSEFTADQYFFLNRENTENYTLSYSFPTEPAPGKYLFTIKAFDAVGNISEKELTFEIL